MFQLVLQYLSVLQKLTRWLAICSKTPVSNRPSGINQGLIMENVSADKNSQFDLQVTVNRDKFLY